MLTVNNTLRLQYRRLIHSTMHAVVTQPDRKPLDIIENQLTEITSENDYIGVKTFISEELQRLHEGILMRYQLTPADLKRWQQYNPQL